MREQYKRPYLDSTIFIGWIKNEVVDGVERGKIADHVLKLAEAGTFQVYTSALTIAEVHKRKRGPTLTEKENETILKYFENEFIQIIDVDRSIGEEANALCRKYSAQGLWPIDAIQMACARRGGCDVLLSWDKTINGIKDFEVPTEEPQIIGQPALPLTQEKRLLLEMKNGANAQDKKS